MFTIVKIIAIKCDGDVIATILNSNLTLAITRIVGVADVGNGEN